MTEALLITYAAGAAAGAVVTAFTALVWREVRR
jgi:hypothetical protein